MKANTKISSANAEYGVIILLQLKQVCVLATLFFPFAAVSRSVYSPIFHDYGQRREVKSRRGKGISIYSMLAPVQLTPRRQRIERRM